MRPAIFNGDHPIVQQHLKTLMPNQQVEYPVVGVTCLDPQNNNEYLIQPCTFHKLGRMDDRDLATTGFKIITNLIKLVMNGKIKSHWKASLVFKMAGNDNPTPLPWPGMPDGRPVPLNVKELPMEPAMFLQGGHFKYKMDREKLLGKIKEIWVPYVKTLMASKA